VTDDSTLINSVYFTFLHWIHWPMHANTADKPITSAVLSHAKMKSCRPI